MSEIAVMAVGATPEHGRDDLGWRVPRAAVAALLCVLVACSPVDSWRHLAGTSKYDPNPATTPNTGNLAAGAALPYPNLATVPPPPGNELSDAQLKELTQSLVADRSTTRHTADQLRAGLVPSPSPSPPPPSPAAGAGAPAQVALGAAPARPSTVAMSPASPPPKVVTPAGAPGKPATGSAAGLPGRMANGLRKPGQPPEPGPMESSLVPPRIPETPQPEAPQPSPPPPRIVAIPASTGGGPAHLPPPPPTVPLPAKIPAFEPPPPPPVLAAPPPPLTAMTAPAPKKPAPPAPVATRVAEIAFAPGSASLGVSDRAALAEAVARWRQSPGTLRVVGYAASGGDPLVSFRHALDQAQAVAAALARLGVPAGRIAAEASPAASAAAGNRAEVLLVH